MSQEIEKNKEKKKNKTDHNSPAQKSVSVSVVYS